ncbi:hypothetical protein Tsubulata_043998 [Turnera subulata]|uniref:Uncharacterized protein n=1 Tax=Turnera subulata TaxID=218843 RepID=A0A9Q0EXT6_9ROSI|nr:hypothetical protein Tsubulata_043998 [Turnera subulata]
MPSLHYLFPINASMRPDGEAGSQGAASSDGRRSRGRLQEVGFPARQQQLELPPAPCYWYLLLSVLIGVAKINEVESLFAFLMLTFGFCWYCVKDLDLVDLLPIFVFVYGPVVCVQQTAFDFFPDPKAATRWGC